MAIKERLIFGTVMVTLFSAEMNWAEEYSSYQDPRQVSPEELGEMPYFGEESPAPFVRSEKRFEGFEDDSPKVPVWSISPSYSIMNWKSDCNKCGTVTGPGISVSYGARSPTEYTGIGAIAGYRRFGDGDRFSGWDLMLGLDSIAYLSGEPGVGRGWFLRGVLGINYSGLNWVEPSQSSSPQTYSNGKRRTETEEIRPYDRFYQPSSTEGSSGTPDEEKLLHSFGILGQIGVGYELKTKGQSTGSVTFLYDAGKSFRTKYSGGTLLVGWNF